MIAADQPSQLPPEILVRVSSRSDDTMLDRSGATPHDQVVQHRRAFCEAVGTKYDDLVHQVIIYNDTQTYARVQEVDETFTYRHRTHGVEADALFTRTPGVGFFLPVADCVATVIYDPRQKFLALLHLGRHSTLTDLLPTMIQKFVHQGSVASDLLVWMSPSAGRSSYKLEWFEKKAEPEWAPFCDVREDGIYLDMQGFNRQRCIDAGIPAGNIEVSPVDTMKDANYFSHAMGDSFGRIAVIAKLL